MHIIIQRTKGANIHKNIQSVIFIWVLHEIFNLVFNLTRSDNVELIQRLKSVNLGKNNLGEASQTE